MKKKNMGLYIGLLILLIIICVISVMFFKKNRNNEYELVKYDDSDFAFIHNINEYQEYKENERDFYTEDEELTEEDFSGKIYLLYSKIEDSCSERTYFKKAVYEDGINKIYFDAEKGCGVCAPQKVTYIIEIEKESNEIETYVKNIKEVHCDPNIAYKPMIYIYPEKDIDLTVKLGNSNLLLHTYPKYKNEWKIRVSKNGNIYDYKTKRNYYGLYWEAIDDVKLNENEGFVVKGEDTVSFLEDKLEILGLNEREINEFIVYWMDKLEYNPYNFIRFRSTDEMNRMMPLNFSETPDTVIRVLMEFKPLDKYKKVKKQTLKKVERKGFTVAEWGGTEYK